MSKCKFFSFAMILILLLVMLVGCNSSSEKPTLPDHNEDASEMKMRTFETVKGDVEIPQKPLRIVTDFYGGELLAVDANVVGVEPTAFNNPFIKDRLVDAADIGQPINVEKVLALDPDLIVVMYDDHYEQLSAIAPTIYLPYGTTTNVYETVELFGDIAANEDEANKFIDRFEEKAQKGREKLASVIDPEATFGIYELTDKGDLWIFGDNAGRGGQALYTALQLKMPIQETEQEQTLQLSMEVLPDYAADYMFLTVYDPDKKGEALEDLKSSPIWQGLDAAKKKQLFYNDFDTFYRYDPIAIYEQIDLFVDMLIERSEENSVK